MWPILDRFDASVAITTDVGGQKNGLLLTANDSNADNMINKEELVKFGFSKTTYGWESSRTGFKMSDLKLWFPDFTKDMVENIDPVVIPHPRNNDDKAEIVVNAPDLIQDEVNPVADDDKKEDSKVSLEKEKKVKKEKIVDSGEKIGRARKDLYANRLITVDDLDSIISSEQKDLVITKASLWKYSYKDAYSRGVDCAVAEWIKQLRMSIPEYGAYNEDRINYEIYAKAIIAIRDLIDPVLSVYELPDALVKLNAHPDFIAFLKEERESYIDSKWSRKARSFKAMVNFSQRKIDDAVEANKPTYYLITYLNYRLIPVSKYPELAKDLSEERLTYLAEYIKYQWSKLGIKTEEQLESMRNKRNEGPKVPERPHLDHLKNDWLSDGDITAKQMMDRFGFRAIEFGEWLPQDERQRVLNEGYAACIALSETLGIPEKLVSFNGELAAAFGSRGSGKAMAHYESDLKVFNLTRMNGAGSMAHEWGHGLDNYLGEYLYDKGKYLSETSHKDARIYLKAFHNKTDVTAFAQNIFANTLRSVDWASSWLRLKDKRDESKKIILQAVCDFAGISIDMDDYDKNQKIDINRITLTSKSNGDSALLYKTLKDEFNRLYNISLRDNPLSVKSNNDASKQFYMNMNSALISTNQIRATLEKLNSQESDGFANVRSNWLSEAQKMDDKKSKQYWSSPKELFARALESYVFDQLHKNDQSCDYLVHSVEGELYNNDSGFIGNPYPCGDERIKITDAISTLVSKIPQLLSANELLRVSIEARNVDNIARAIKDGADINHPDRDGSYPLELYCASCGYGKTAALDLMLEKGANPFIGTNTIHHMMKESYYQEKLLTSAYLNDIQNIVLDGVKASSIMMGDAIKSCSIDNIKRIIPFCDINASCYNIDGKKPIDLAMLYGRSTEIIELLIDSGAEITDEIKESIKPTGNQHHLSYLFEKTDNGVSVKPKIKG